MFLLKQILPAAIAALAVALGISGLAFWIQKERIRAIAVPLAAGLAYMTGHFIVAGWVSFPPKDTTNWLPYLALVGGIVGASCLAPGASLPVRIAISIMVSLVALRLLLRPKFQYGWSPLEGWVWVIALAVGIALLVLILDRSIHRSAMAWETPALLALVCGGVFGALLLSGSMLLGQSAAVLGAGSVGALVPVARSSPLSKGITLVFSLLSGALLVCGYFFASLPAISAVLLGVSLLPACLPIHLASLFLTGALRVALVSIPVIGALVIAFTSSPPIDY